MVVRQITQNSWSIFYNGQIFCVNAMNSVEAVRKFHEQRNSK